MLEFAHLVNKLANSTSPIEFRPLPEDDPKQRKPDITRAQEILGWEPKIGLEEGLGHTLEYFRQKISAA